MLERGSFGCRILFQKLWQLFSRLPTSIQTYGTLAYPLLIFRQWSGIMAIEIYYDVEQPVGEGTSDGSCFESAALVRVYTVVLAGGRVGGRARTTL
ncbi:hypothetical protein Gotur_029222 [Gossypium turneri]